MRYVRPTSLTWWAGVFLIAMGCAQAAGWPSGGGDSPEGLAGALGAVTAALTAILGGAGAETAPAALIGLGAGLIGLRDALVRDRERTEWAIEDRHAEILAAMDPMDDRGDAALTYDLPPGESPLPPGVIDPFGPGGSRE